MNEKRLDATLAGVLEDCVNSVGVDLNTASVSLLKFVAGLNASLVIDIPVMFAVMAIMTLPALFKGKLARWQGISLLCIYAAFMVMQFVFVRAV